MAVGDGKEIEKAAHRLRVLMLLWLFVWNADSLHAADARKGFVFWETFQGNANTIGTVAKLDTMVGYTFNRHFEVDAGLPFYFVRPSSSAMALGAATGNGIGNAYLSMHFGAATPAVTFVSSLTGSAPTGDVDRGFSTGHVTVDWNNYVGFEGGRITPFGNLGLANSISDTRFFTRPFTSLGTVAHFEGGADVELTRVASLGGSVYADAPFGRQTIYSKLVGRSRQNAPGRGTGGSGRGGKRGVFESQSVTVGTADLARDRGASVWLDIDPAGTLDVEVGYSRSFEYDLSSVFFTVRLNLGKWIRSRR